eukprot:TRINITY_DN12945_c0_g6_i2.p1 TRINITY_DN12945_c0_g6~~TRINITY_DN12945_c0_g6_i2.p1  ORF type:complete len:144 (+),score=13.83 TRINITY_DN12945_c0_g6_i2:288-719(+)
MSKGCAFFSSPVSEEHVDGHIEYVDYCRVDGDVEGALAPRGRSARSLCPITCGCVGDRRDTYLGDEEVLHVRFPERASETIQPEIFLQEQCPACCFWQSGFVPYLDRHIAEQGLQCINRHLKPGELAILQQNSSSSPARTPIN